MIELTGLRSIAAGNGISIINVLVLLVFFLLMFFLGLKRCSKVEA